MTSRMHTKLLLAVVIGIVTCHVDLSANNTPLTVTVGNTTYENVRWGAVTGDTVSIFHKDGVATIKLADLPEEYRHLIPKPAVPALEPQQPLPATTVNRDAADGTAASDPADIPLSNLIEVTRKTRPAVVSLVVHDAQGREIGTGSGFIASPDGKIISNYHVIERAMSVTVKTLDGQTFAVTGFLAADKTNDLVVLKIDGEDLPYLEFSETALPEQGSRVAVIGSPIGLQGTLTEGIVSAIREMANGHYWLQMTAAISPGSSGSPVLNADGQVVGVAVAQMANSQGVNFAVAGQHAEDLLFQSELKRGPQAFASMQRARLGDIRQDADYQTYLALFVNNDFKQAVDVLKTLLDRYPHSAIGYRELGDVYWSLGRYNDSAKAYQQAVKLNPQYVEAWRELGESYEAMMSYTDAIAAYRQALQLNGGSPTLWCSLGQALVHQEQFFDAVGALRKSIQIKSEHAPAWSSLGHAYFKLNKLQDAAGALREAVRLQPDDPLAWYRLGLTCNGMGRFDDEIAAYERAVNLRADFADAWHNLTVAYAKSRQFEKAWNAVRKLEAIDSYRANTLASYLAERSPKSMQARVGLGD